MASPAECVRSILLKAEFVVWPADDLTLQPDEALIPCYVNQFPDQPDFIMSLYDKQGMTFGRLQSGKYLSHPGVKVMVRALDATQAYDTMSALSTLIAARQNRQSVPIRGNEHFVANVYQTGDIMSLGEQTGTARATFVMNLQVAMEDLATTPLE